MLNEEEVRQTRYELIKSLSEISGYHPDNYNTQLMVTTAIRAYDKLSKYIQTLTKQVDRLKDCSNCEICLGSPCCKTCVFNCIGVPEGTEDNWREHLCEGEEE